MICQKQYIEKEREFVEKVKKFVWEETFVNAAEILLLLYNFIAITIICIFSNLMLLIFSSEPTQKYLPENYIFRCILRIMHRNYSICKAALFNS